MRRIEGDLDQSIAVAEVDEDEAAEIPGTMHPAAEADLGAGMGRAELPAQGGAERSRKGFRACHQNFTKSGCSRADRGRAHRLAATQVRCEGCRRRSRGGSTVEGDLSPAGHWVAPK